MGADRPPIEDFHVPRPPRARLTMPEPLLFLGLRASESQLSKARVVVIPAPFDQTTSYLPGTRFGPKAILEASRQVEFYDEELDREPFEIGVATLAEIEVEPADIEAGLRKLEATVAEVAAKGKIPLTLGGEHSLTLAPGGRRCGSATRGWRCSSSMPTSTCAIHTRGPS